MTADVKLPGEVRTKRLGMDSFTFPDPTVKKDECERKRRKNYVWIILLHPVVWVYLAIFPRRNIWVFVQTVELLVTCLYLEKEMT